MFDDVVMLEPVQKFVDEAKRSCREGKWKGIEPASASEPANSTKSVTFMTGPLQDFDPVNSVEGQRGNFAIERIGSTEAEVDGFDVVWCQVSRTVYAHPEGGS